MSAQTNLNIIRGEPLLSEISKDSLGVTLYHQLKAHSQSKSPALLNVTTKESISHERLLELSCKLSEWMRLQGLRQNNIILLACENIAEYYVPVLAAFYSCIVVANAGPHYTESEMTHVVTLVQPKMIFCTKAAKPTLEKLAKNIQLPKIIGMESLVPLIEGINVDIWNFQPKPCDVNEQAAAIMFSSGTTGLFKGVVLTHRNYNARLNQIMDPRISIPGNRVLLFLPFYHAYGFVSIMAGLYKGQQTIFMPKFDLPLFLQSIEKYQISMLPLVPPVMVLISKSPLVRNYNLASVQHVLCGAAPLSSELEEIARKIFPNASIRQGYGLTEVTFAATLFDIRYKLDKKGSCGKAVPGSEVVVRHPETGRNLGAYEVGEFCLKSATVMKGYLNNPEATKATFTKDGFLRTGDMCYYDNDKYFFIVDRLKELIKYKAIQIAPAELEALLLTHPKVLDAAVIGRKDEVAGEVPMGFVVKKGDITEKELIDFVAKNVSHHKQLRGGVRFINSIPKNPSGKILRKILRNLPQARL